MDVYCRNCGEPWDTWSLKEDFTEEERKMFLSGKGCPACKGVPTMYCENCDEVYKWWMRRDMIKEEVELIWKHKKCPKCMSDLKVVKFDGEYISSIVECDGAIEDITDESILDYI